MDPFDAAMKSILNFHVCVCHFYKRIFATRMIQELMVENRFGKKVTHCISFSFFKSAKSTLCVLVDGNSKGNEEADKS